MDHHEKDQSSPEDKKEINLIPGETQMKETTMSQEEVDITPQVHQMAAAAASK